MRVLIKSEQKKGFNLIFPNVMVKSKTLWKMILRSLNVEETEIERTIVQIKKIYKDLKTYIKKCGHFNLIEVYSNNGEVIIVRI